MKREKHWTERSLEDFAFSLLESFKLQLDKKEVAKTRNTKSLERLTNPTLFTLLSYILPLKKLALVIYDKEGAPVDSEIFRICWEKMGRPTNYWELEKIND